MNRQKQKLLLSTRIPLESDKVSLRFGPATLEEMQLEKEDIGLAQPVITIDYPSPINKRVRYGGVSLSPL